MKKVVNKIINKSCEQKLWAEAVINSYQQKLWAKVVKKMVYKKLLIKVSFIKLVQEVISLTSIHRKKIGKCITESYFNQIIYFSSTLKSQSVRQQNLCLSVNKIIGLNQVVGMVRRWVREVVRWMGSLWSGG